MTKRQRGRIIRLILFTILFLTALPFVTLAVNYLV